MHSWRALVGPSSGWLPAAMWLFVVAHPGDALGQSPGPTPSPLVRPDAEHEKRADEHYRRGLRAFDERRYDEAITSFRAAFELTKLPGFLFNIALAQRKSRNCAEALATYERYLQLKPNAHNRAVVERHVAEMRRCVARRRAAQASMKTGAASPAPSVRPVPRQPDPRQPREPRRRSLWPPLLIGGLGLAAGAAGAVLMVDALSTHGDLSDDCAPSCDRSRWEGAQTRHRVGVVLVVAGSAAVATGVTLLLWQTLGSREPETMAVVPTLGGLTVRVRY